MCSCALLLNLAAMRQSQGDTADRDARYVQLSYNDGRSWVDSNLSVLTLTRSTSEGRFCWEILVYLQRGICSVDLLRYDLNIGALRKTKMLNLGVLRMGEQLSGSPTAVEHSIVLTILVDRDVYMYIQLLVHIS